MVEAIFDAQLTLRLWLDGILLASRTFDIRISESACIVPLDYSKVTFYRESE